MTSNAITPILLHLVYLFIFISGAKSSLGVNWGTTSASHPLPPSIVVNLLKSNNIAKVRIFDADPLALQALSGSNIKVTLGISDYMLQGLNFSLRAAQNWVHDNLTRYADIGVHFQYVVVGENPFLLKFAEQFQPFVVGAATNIQKALMKAKLDSDVNVVVPCSFDAFGSKSGLPSGGRFRSDVNETMIHLLSFLTRYRSPFFVDISPFQSMFQNKNLSLDLTLFKESARLVKDNRRSYENSFDLIYDTLVSAFSASGFPRMDIVIGKIGWPTDGSINANSSVAEVFMKGLTDHLRSKNGTPLRPKTPPLETFIFSLIDEDQRSTDSGGFERHWGLFTFDGLAKYQMDISQSSKNLVNAQNVQYMPLKWCVVNDNKDLSNASFNAVNACASADCSALSRGGSCFNKSWPLNVSYAFNSFFQVHDQLAESCDFKGLGLITTVDPSSDDCRFFVQIQTSCSAFFTATSLMMMMMIFYTAAASAIFYGVL